MREDNGASNGSVGEYGSLLQHANDGPLATPTADTTTAFQEKETAPSSPSSSFCCYVSRREFFGLEGQSCAGLWLCRFLWIVVVVLAAIKACTTFLPWRGDALTATAGFDYIVVGGGPSGIIAAVKLARAFPTLAVLLLESGTASQGAVLDHNTIEPEKMRPGTRASSSSLESANKGALWNDGNLHLNKFDIPLMWSGVASDQGRRQVMHMEESWSDHHWPIKRTLLGRALGGCGLHNAMIYARSLPTDFVQWNLTGWTWANLLPHYVALERFVDTTPRFEAPFWKNATSTRDKPWRGTNGPITTIPAGVGVDAIAPLFVESALASGHGLAEEGFNSPDPLKRIGAGYYEFNVRNGVRDSVANALLGNEDRPSNLVVQTGITVTQVLMAAGTDGIPRTSGVEYVRDKKSASVGKFLLNDKDSKAEVILASGAILTPQLLFNSGIGQGGSLVDLPGVGKNLQDHPVTAMAFRISPEIARTASSIYTVADEMEDYFLSVAQLEGLQRDSTTVAEAVLSDVQERLGTFGTAGFSAGAFLRSPWANNESPDIQLTVFPRVIEPHVVRKMKESDEAFMRSSAMLISIALLQPEARYEVRPSQSQNSLVPPSTRRRSSSDDDSFEAASSRSYKLRPGMFRTEVDETNPLAKILGYRLPSIELPPDKERYLSDLDAKRIAWGMEQVRKIQQQTPLANQTEDELHPGANITGEELEAYVHASNLPNSHWVGSTKMGTADDPLAVVDEELRVLGVNGLRIVDSGVIPIVPNGNTHSTVCVVASRAADLIADARRSKS